MEVKGINNYLPVDIINLRGDDIYNKKTNFMFNVEGGIDCYEKQKTSIRLR